MLYIFVYVECSCLNRGICTVSPCWGYSFNFIVLHLLIMWIKWFEWSINTCWLLSDLNSYNALFVASSVVKQESATFGLRAGSGPWILACAWQQGVVLGLGSWNLHVSHHHFLQPPTSSWPWCGHSFLLVESCAAAWVAWGGLRTKARLVQPAVC